MGQRTASCITKAEAEPCHTKTKDRIMMKIGWTTFARKTATTRNNNLTVFLILYTFWSTAYIGMFLFFKGYHITGQFKTTRKEIYAYETQENAKYRIGRSHCLHFGRLLSTRVYGSNVFCANIHFRACFSVSRGLDWNANRPGSPSRHSLMSANPQRDRTP